jgi:hypothetical protein
VPSVGAIGTLAGLAGNIVSAVEPGLTAPINLAEGIVNLAEGAISAITQTSTTTVAVKPAA